MPSPILRAGLRLLLGAAAGFAAAFPVPGPPASAAEPPAAEPSFFGTVEVELTELEVLVLDRKGAPVPGLAREDFEVLEDERPVTLTHFVPPAPPAPEAAPEPDAEAEFLPVPPPEGADGSPDRIFLVFVDEDSIEPWDRRLALQGIGEVLADGGTTMMIVAHGRSGDRTVLEPTTDPAAAAVAVERLVKETPVGELAADRRRMRSELEGLAPSFARLQELRAFSELAERERAFILSEVGRLQASIRSHAKIERAAGEKTLDSLRRLSLALCGRVGAKTLLYLGSGVPQTPGQEMMMAWEHHFGAFMPEMRTSSEIAGGLSESLVSRLSEVASFLNACGANFLAVDASGLRPSASISAASASGTEVMGSFEEAGIQDRRAGLLHLAEATGGSVTPGGQGLAGRLRKAREGPESVYLLAYPRPAGQAGKTRHIDVRLPGQKGLRIRHRRTFADVTSDVVLEQRVLATLQFGPGTENPLDVRVETGAPTPGKDGVFEVPVRVRVRLGRVGIEPGEREHKGHLTLAIAARDERGRVSPVQVGEQAISIPHDKLLAALNGEAAYTFSVRVRGERQRLAVAVRDDVTRLISVGQVELEPPG